MPRKRDEEAGSSGTASISSHPVVVLGEVGLFGNLDKSRVVQDVRIFSESPLNIRRCCSLLTRALYLLYHHQSGSNSRNDAFDRTEATTIFFAVTKAFQCKDPLLRRLTFLVVRELAPIADDVIIVISSLTQDITSRSEPSIRANAIRALGSVTDASLVPGIERFIKQCMLDRERVVSAAALVTAVHFHEVNAEAVRRWVTEAQQSLSNARDSSQYLAVLLLFLIRQGDRMALLKLVRELLSSSTHPMTAVLALQIYARLCRTGFVQPAAVMDLKPFLRYKGKQDMVALETARLVCDSTLYSSDVSFAVTALGSLLSSPRTASRFAALKTLSQLAARMPEQVTPLNADLERLVGDANRAVATVAITTLLKTGTETSIDGLLGKIGEYVAEISDEFRVVIVEAVHRLCLRFPARYPVMLDFLGRTLRDEGGREFKRAAVDAVCELLDAIPSSRDAALLHLCEFIEDSEYAELTVRVVHLLGEQTSRTTVSNAALIVRCIANRLVLEGSSVRVAAVGALAKIAATMPAHRPGITSILRTCSLDTDDDVRERAILGLHALSQPDAKSVLCPETFYDLDALEERLEAFLQNSGKATAMLRLDDIPQVPISTLRQPKAEASQELQSQAVVPEVESVSAAAPVASSSIPGDYGECFRSSPAISLTEPEAEYVVHVIKHVFAEHLVLEFICQNTVKGQTLRSVRVDVRCDSNALKSIRSVPIEQLPFDTSASAFVIFACPTGSRPQARFECALRFTAHEADDSGEPVGPGSNEQYPVAGVDLDTSDYIRPLFQASPELDHMPTSSHDTFTLTAIDSVASAVRELLVLIGGAPLHGSDAVPLNADGHKLLIAGTVYPAHPFLATCQLSRLGPSGISLGIDVRAKDPSIANLVIELIS